MASTEEYENILGSIRFTEQKMDTEKSSLVDTEATIAGASFLFYLHPLALINISDHFTRDRVRKNSPTRVIGALLGDIHGKVINIQMAYELCWYQDEAGIHINEAYFVEKLNQMKQVVPEYDLLGWYSTGKEVSTLDMKIHQQVMSFVESPIYLLVDLESDKPQTSDIPVTLYESELVIVNDEPQLRFLLANYKIETVQSERIAVDHIAKAAKGGSIDPTCTHLQSISNAATMLNTRIEVIQRYLDAVKSGSLTPDYVLLRKIKSLCSLLPAMNTEEFQHDFVGEYNDSLMTTYLAMITNSTNIAYEVAERFHGISDRSGGMMSGRHFGLARRGFPGAPFKML